MGIVDDVPEPAKLADWLDEQFEAFEKQAIEWIDASLQRRLFSYALRIMYPTAALGLDATRMGVPGIIDVLRLGSDFDLSTKGSAVKTVGINVMRVLTVAQPIAGGARNLATRTAVRGMLAMDSLPAIATYEGLAAKGPCTYQAINNIVSFFKGAPKQVFVDVLDIIAERGQNAGHSIGLLLESSKVKAAFGEAGIIAKTLAGMRETKDVLGHVMRTGEPTTFSLEWSNATGQHGHVMMALRAPNGSVRIFDYAESVFGASPNNMGFGSIEEMFQARKLFAEWQGFNLGTLRTGAEYLPRAYTTRYFQILWTVEQIPVLAYPVLVGLRWSAQNTLAAALKEMVPSFAKHLFDSLGSEAPAPPPSVGDALPPLPVVGSGPPTSRADLLDLVYVGGSGAMLSQMSQKYYQTLHMWPLIWAANFELIGANPNRIPSDIYLKILKPEKYPSNLVADARRISPDWNAYQRHVDWARKAGRTLGA
jgi:hypothetical protein